MTGANSLHMDKPDHAAQHGTEAPLDQNRAGLQGHDARDEKRQDANHEQADVANLEQLVEDLSRAGASTAAAPQRLPEQHHDFSNMLKHHDLARQRRAFFFATVHMADAPAPAFRAD